MNLFTHTSALIAAATSGEENYSFVPFLIFAAILILFFSYSSKKTKQRFDAAMKAEREKQELQKETIALLKEISAKLDK